MPMAGDITVKGPCFAQHYALGKWLEYPIAGRKFPNGKVDFISFAHVSKPVHGVKHATEEWSPRDFATYWTLETEVGLMTIGGMKYTTKELQVWVPFFWARDLDDVLAVVEFLRSGTVVRIVNADTGETIPLHVL